MKKIDLYFKNNQIPSARVSENDYGNISLSLDDGNGGYCMKQYEFTKEEASYLASALRMVLGQEKAAQPK